MGQLNAGLMGLAVPEFGAASVTAPRGHAKMAVTAGSARAWEPEPETAAMVLPEEQAPAKAVRVAVAQGPGRSWYRQEARCPRPPT